MEQYFMPKELDWEHLRYCLDNYTPTKLYIRDCGGHDPDGSFRIHGQMKVNEDLVRKTLDFTTDDGLAMLIDGVEVFKFKDERDKGFSVAYERVECGVRLWCNAGDPDDPNLPEPDKSILRHLINDHLMEIDFKEKILIKKHSPWHGMFYWQLR